jgi:steroid delta-isomerase-like uncharacterized protein
LSAETNKQIVRRVAEEPWGGNFEAIDELVDPGYTGYDPSQPEPTRGPAGFREFITTYLTGFPDGGITVDQQLAEGDFVATRWTGRGTHQGDLMGIAATGKQVTVSGITISRVSNGKIVEEWTNWDTLGMLQQLGVVPSLAGTQAR